jgi:hypothetical protein
MSKQALALTVTLATLAACTSIPARAADRGVASTAPVDQYFYGVRSIDGKTIASMIVKRSVDRSSGKIVEQVTDCDYNTAAKRRVTPYQVEFKVRADGFYSFEEVLQNSFRGTGQVKNDEWTAWTSHSFSPTEGWTLISDDKIKEVTPGRRGLAVKKIFAMAGREMELSEDFTEIEAERYQAIQNAYTKNANNSSLECVYKM